MKRAIAAAAIMMIALPAQAHSEEELEDWLEHHERVGDMLAESPEFTDLQRKEQAAFMAERLRDMEQRHPCSKIMGTWTDENCLIPVIVDHEDPGSSGSSGNRGMGSNVEQWRPLVAAYFSADKVDMALCVMAGESGGNPNADNPTSTAAGLMQFLQSTWDNMVPLEVTGGSYSSGQVYDPEANIRAAAWLQNAAGWSQWNAAARC